LASLTAGDVKVARAGIEEALLGRQRACPFRGSSRSRRASFMQSTIIIAIIAVSLGSATAQVAGRAITFVVPYSPGTGPDILARIVGEEIEQRWRQPVVIENKLGASLKLQ
jgi:hypothetical protein